MNRSSIFLLCLCLCLGLATAGKPARATPAGSMLERLPVAFGTFILTDNTAQHTIQISPSGAETLSSGIYRMHPGENGLWSLTGYLHLPPDTFYITVDPDPAPLVMYNGTATFDISSFTFDPPCTMATPCSVDGSGNLEVRVGATLTTRVGTTYLPGAYRGTYTIMLNF